MADAFTKKFKFKGVARPQHREAPYPPFDPKAINTSRFEDEVRPKEWGYEYDEDTDTLFLDWLSQEDLSDHSEFWTEVKRCMDAIGFKGTIVVNLQSRDGGDFWSLSRDSEGIEKESCTPEQ